MARKAKVSTGAAFTAHMNGRIRGEVEAAFNDGRVESLLMATMAKKHIAPIERMARDAMQAYVKTARDVLLEGFEPMDGTSFTVPIGLPNGAATMTTGSKGSKPWAPLTEKTKIKKLLKGYQRKVWAHRFNEQYRIVMALTPAMHRLGTAKAKLVEVWPKGKVEKIGGKTQITVRYALVFPIGSGHADEALAKMVMPNFLAGRWKPLNKASMEPTGSGFRGGRNRPPDPRTVLYVEAARPWIGPTAAYAGDMFRARLKNQLKP